MILSVSASPLLSLPVPLSLFVAGLAGVLGVLIGDGLEGALLPVEPPNEPPKELPSEAVELVPVLPGYWRRLLRRVCKSCCGRRGRGGGVGGGSGASTGAGGVGALGITGGNGSSCGVAGGNCGAGAGAMSCTGLTGLERENRLPMGVIS